VKRAILLIVLAGGVAWLTGCGSGAKPADAKPTGAAAADEEAGAQVTRDEKGNVVIKISDEMQGNMGLLVAQPAAIQWSPELKGYGRVLDPATISAAVGDWVSAGGAAEASQKELARLKTLAEQNNASVRALEAANVAATRDSALADAARARLQAATSKMIAERPELAAFARSLTSGESALVRIDLPAGGTSPSPSGEARVVTLSGNSQVAEFLGEAAGVDPQTQSRGLLLLIKTNSARLVAGEAVTGYLKVSGEPLAGVIIPREAVVRTDGAGWVYVADSSGEGYVRTEIALDRPTDAGWFVTKAVTASDHVVVTGAAQLLSEERKGA
jgi:hypothetical protein